MKKILVVGGAGYVGSELVKKLLILKHKISVLDLFMYGRNTIPDDKNIIKIIGDIRDENLWNRSLKDIDVVVHLACISNDPSFELNPALGRSINFECFEPFVKRSIKHNVKKFIYASSSSVYGVSKALNVDENHELKPLTDYSKFKVECEQILKKYSNELLWTIVRPATVCGYSSRQRFDLVVNILTNLAYNKGEIIIYGGNQLRPNIHIKDMVNAYIKIIDCDNEEKTRNQIYNVGFENKSLDNLAQLVKDTVSKNLIIKKITTDDNRSYHISSHKFSKNFNFKYKYSISDAINDLVSAFKENKFQDPLSNQLYFNIKQMQSISLK